jgi:heptosyltransferase-2
VTADVAPRRIVVRAPNWVGDLVMATPALRALRRRFPSASITLLARSSGLKLLDGSPFLDDGIAHPGGVLSAARRVRRGRFDLAVILPNSHSSALETVLGLVPRRVGYDLNLRGLLLTRCRRPRVTGHRRVPLPMTRSYLDLVALLGAPADDERVELHVTPEAEDLATRWLRERGVDPGRPLLGVAPGASFGPSKRWCEDRFGHAAEALAVPRDLPVVVLGGPGEEKLGARVAMHCRAKVVNPDGAWVDLSTLKALARRCSLVLATDSGTRHVATALGVPVVVLIGPTNPTYTATNLRRTVVLREPVDCAPCHLRECPIDHRCMTRIPAERVVEAGERLLTAVEP